MPTLPKNWGIYAACILALGSAIIIVIYSAAGSQRGPDLPDTFWFQCTDCRHKYQLTYEEFRQQAPPNPRDVSDGQPPTLACPACAKPTAVNARKCPECGEVFAAWELGTRRSNLARSVYECPNCGWTKQVESGR